MPQREAREADPFRGIGHAADDEAGFDMIDISNPWQPEELGYYLPEPGEGHNVAQSNDVFATPDGLYYLVDRLGGFEILEWVGH